MALQRPGGSVRPQHADGCMIEAPEHLHFYFDSERVASHDVDTGRGADPYPPTPPGML